MTTSDQGSRQDIADAVLSLPVAVAAAFGLTFTALAAGRAEAWLGWRPEHSHTPGAFQANPIAALADFTGVDAGVTLLPPGGAAATVDYTAKFLTEARGDHLIARARVLRPGTTLTVAAVDISVARNGTETLCAAVLITMRNIAHRARSAADAAGRPSSATRSISGGGFCRCEAGDFFPLQETTAAATQEARTD